MINVSDEIKQAYDISTTQLDKIKLDNIEYPITNVQYYDDCYENGNVFGTAIARVLEFEIENNVDLEGKEFKYLTGIEVNGITQWITLGNFIVQDVEPNDTTNINKITAIDYMLKTNIPYVTNLNYSTNKVTLLMVLQELCEKSNLVLATTDFANKDFIVDSNQFVEGTLNRQVLQAIAQITGTVAKIKNDNRLYLINPNKVTNISKIFTLNNYEEAEIKRNTHPINLVALGMSNIEGEDTVLKDSTSISQNGENSLVINDNPFAYTQAKREQLIPALFEAVKGFEYKAYLFKCQGLPYLETLDKVQFQDKEGNTYNSYLFRFNYKSPKGLESEIEAPSIIKATVNYQNVQSVLERIKRTEILVDQQNQTITGVVENVDDQNKKISETLQKVDEITSKISDIADITVSKESTNAILEFEDINQSEPISIKIYPIGNNISYLYPHDNLYPSDDLFMTTRTLRFTNTTTNKIFDYELPDDLLIYDNENYDEFVFSYDSLSVMINKKCCYNADGTVGLLDTPKTINYDFPKIELTDGDYKVELLGYSNAYMFVRLMVQNIYTTQFATKAELNSEIKQTTEEVDISVNKKLENYSTTDEMNSAINVKANQITSSVNEKFENYDTSSEVSSKIQQSADSITNTVKSTYTTKTDTEKQINSAKSEFKQTTDNISSEVSKKVGNNEIISKINQSAETVGIDADKIELTVNDILNLLAGNAINLTSKNIVITSDIFNVDKEGNVTLKTNGGKVIKVENSNNSKQRVYMTDKFLVVDSATDYDRASMGLIGDNGGYFSATSSSGSNSMMTGDGVQTPLLTQFSLEKLKKNFNKLNTAIDIIKDAEIYTYNLKAEKDTDKKHYGFVIGEKYNTPKEVISKDGQGIDTYSMSSIMWKALQEVIVQNENLQKEIENLKGVK